jgi:hypothetical protein
MPLIFAHDRLDFGQFPDLMPQRCRIVAGKFRAATAAFGRFGRLHFVALLAGNQRPLMFLVARLPTAFLLRLATLRLRPRVGMLRTGRQRGVLRRLAFHQPLQRLDPRLQFRVVRQQRANDRLGFGRLTSNDFFSDLPLLSPNTATRVQISSLKTTPQGVNAYYPN